MLKEINSFLKKNRYILLTSVLLNVIFLLVVFVILNSVYGISVLKQSGDEFALGENNAIPRGGGEEERVVDVVSLANPAVVSIVATTDLPQISQDQRMFFEFFAPYLDLDNPISSEKRQVGAGSGFFVSSDGYLVTNRHVVENDSFDYTVVTADNSRYAATVVAKDPIFDVAIMKVDITNAPYLEFGDSDKIRLGESVIAIGNALAEFSNSVTKGVVSGLSRSIVAQGRAGQEFLENVIQTDAGINPGNSGGPLLDLNGKVVGVNVAVAVSSENIGFALPANLVSNIVDSVREEGRIVRPYMGVRYLNLNEQIAEEAGLSVSEGAYINSGGADPAVIPGSPADVAGLISGDVILEFNGRELNSKTSLQQVIRESRVGETVDIKILRNDEERVLPLTLEEAPEDL